ncbi:MAG: S46 family peptidase [Draconibacterium sp.]
MIKRITFLVTLLLVINVNLLAKEGMWIPIFLEKYNLAEMQQMGFRLTAKDIYDVNNASMKDAVVIFGGGCTGELISGDGLLITNHHCGLGQVQRHSSVEHDYLTNGFWAMNRGEELSNPGLTVSFLEYMEDVTDKVLNGTASLSPEETAEKVQENIAAIRKEAEKDGKFSVQVKPLFYGNQYFMYVHKVYRDVRLVGAPPSAIGKFGGDTDNWVWPRHTGDFTIFRVYAGKDNEPADYSPENVPMKSKRFFPVSIKGVQPGDFTMVFGNPGSTMQYIPSHEVSIIQLQRDPDRVRIRDKKLEIIGADMEKDSKVRIQYTSKYQGISNAWKKWQGEIKGLQRMNAVQKKKDFEKEFKDWAVKNGVWEDEYKTVFANFDTLYATYKPYIKAADIYNETVNSGIELFTLAGLANNLLNAIENKQPEKAETARNSIKRMLPGFYKNYNQPTDEKLFVTLLPILMNDVDAQFLPAGLVNETKKYDEDELVNKIYRKSPLTDSLYWKKMLDKDGDKWVLKLRKDPLFSWYNRLKFKYNTDIVPVVTATNTDITANMKIYMAGIMEMKKDQALYADANMTLRVSYGKVEGYQPADGVYYKHFTTLKGIIEKDNPAIYDYDVPDRLKELYKKKDFGKYEVDGTVPVCFIASNHTTGGNSGSPVVNGNGELIGINFDRVWEGTMSDIMFDPEVCRNISLDMRFVLFIIDKYAGAGYLIDEMKVVE